MFFLLLRMLIQLDYFNHFFIQIQCLLYTNHRAIIEHTNRWIANVGSEKTGQKLEIINVGCKIRLESPSKTQSNTQIITKRIRTISSDLVNCSLLAVYLLPMSWILYTESKKICKFRIWKGYQKHFQQLVDLRERSNLIGDLLQHGNGFLEDRLQIDPFFINVTVSLGILQRQRLSREILEKICRNRELSRRLFREVMQISVEFLVIFH